MGVSPRLWSFLPYFASLAALFAWLLSSYHDIAHQPPTAKTLHIISNVKYAGLASYIWLDPAPDGQDILTLEAFRSLLPIDLFETICANVKRLQDGIIVWEA
jgi:hypothetical protein